MVNGRIRIGTSGWHYRHWIGPFYPDGTPARAMLGVYAARFGTVEINNSFYRLPRAETLRAWRDGTPDGFVFAFKANRFITQAKKLTDPVASTKRLFGVVDALGDKLGPILFQLPPRWRVNAERLAAFLAALPQGYRYAFELRNDTWFTDEVLALLKGANAAFCIYELAGRQSPLGVTADFVYLRLHGPGGAYQGSYDRGALRRWAARCAEWAADGRDVYGYFDNDQSGFATANAATLAEMIGTESQPAVRIC